MGRFLLFSFLVCLCCVNRCSGYYHYQERLPNGNNVNHPCKANYKWPGVGHTNPLGGGHRNAFGLAFRDAGYMWTRSLCQADTDGDGMTNGQELGDPDCVWQKGQIPKQTKDITNPGVCEPIGSPKCEGKSDFVNCELDKFDTCDRIRQTGTTTVDLKFPETTVPEQETTYMCMTFDLPVGDDGFHIVATEPILDNLDVMHHIILFSCSDDVQDIPEPKQCRMSGDYRCREIVAGWTVGNPGMCFPDLTGMRVANSTFHKVSMTIHWNNPEKRSDQRDGSGIRLYLQPASDQVHDLATLIVGQELLEIPPGQKSVVKTGRCPGQCSPYLLSEPIHVTQVINHMHYLGHSQKVEVYRQGQLVATLSNDENFNYDSPVLHSHDPAIQVLPGDEIRTRCEYNSLSSQNYVYYGDGTQDEMCFAFIIAYPTKAFRGQRYWASFGPMSTCDLFATLFLDQPYRGCDLAALAGFKKSEEMAEIHQRLKQDCNLDGRCRPECARTLAELRENHPCFSEELSTLMPSYLSKFSKDSLSLLGRMFSCPKPGAEGTCTREMCGCADTP